MAALLLSPLESKAVEPEVSLKEYSAMRFRDWAETEEAVKRERARVNAKTRLITRGWNSI
jgi:hypothetical protein